ncbi:hypothetical protein HFP72_21080 [Nocardiopsis sp. ARC36]
MALIPAAHDRKAAMTPREELAKMHLKSAFRWRGCFVSDPVEAIAVAVSWGPNRMVLRVAGGKWSREDPTVPGRLVAVGDVGEEDAIARRLTPELTDRKRGPKYAAIR